MMPTAWLPWLRRVVMVTVFVVFILVLIASQLGRGPGVKNNMVTGMRRVKAMAAVNPAMMTSFVPIVMYMVPIVMSMVPFVIGMVATFMMSLVILMVSVMPLFFGVTSSDFRKFYRIIIVWLLVIVNRNHATAQSFQS